MNEAFCRCDRQPNKRFNPACTACAKINRNRKAGIDLARKTRLEDQVQRLQTYNDLLHTTLADLYVLHTTPGISLVSEQDTLKKVRKVIGL